MLRDYFSVRGAALVAAFGFLAVAGGRNTPVRAQCGHGGSSGHAGHAGGHAGHGGGHAGHQHDNTPGPAYFDRAPHGGQVTVQLPYFFEVVYQPRETHVYIYRPLEEPLRAQDVRGEVGMQPRYSPETFRFPLTYVPPSADSLEENHLVAVADVSRVPDGQMTVTFKLDNLPLPEVREIVFRQTFALTRPAPRVAVAALTEADEQGIDRQQVCPVTKASLGSMGPPVKVLLNDQPLYLCCAGCVAKVQQDPQAYLPRPSAVQPEQPGYAMRVPPMDVAPLTETDWPGIAQQQVCPVTHRRLGSMGPPVKLLEDGQPLYLCCQGCVAQVRENPQGYFPQPAAARAEKPFERPRAPQVNVVPVTAADRTGIARQQTCPVTGARLGSMGDPIKLTLDGQVLYVCCEGCVGKVQQNPVDYLARAAPRRAGP